MSIRAALRSAVRQMPDCPRPRSASAGANSRPHGRSDMRRLLSVAERSLGLPDSLAGWTRTGWWGERRAWEHAHLDASAARGRGSEPTPQARGIKARCGPRGWRSREARRSIPARGGSGDFREGVGVWVGGRLGLVEPGRPTAESPPLKNHRQPPRDETIRPLAINESPTSADRTDDDAASARRMDPDRLVGSVGARASGCKRRAWWSM